ncbi:FG-GAP-like repeat-containing protein [Hymenobacter busanensis]|nr:FG-GAP-like repeat-containing protein [Hymenobacter busanensis]QHJ09164.1 T9SS type A sorting domain-containing protein [Hymenobacter busanensis]
MLLASAAWAQGPMVSSLAPARHAPAAARNANVQLTLSQPAAATAALHVFSSRSGGKKAGTSTVAGNTVTFDPSSDFKPGETLTATLTNAGGPMHTWQFTAAVGGGTGVFGGGSDFNFQNNYTAINILPGDFDNDNDLDAMVVAQQSGAALLINNGAGQFTRSSAGIPNTNYPTETAVGDIDGDGDLDVVSSPSRPYAITVARNNGNLNFVSAAALSINPISTEINSLTLADIDGDADLDLCHLNPVAKQITIWPNDGTGNFGPARTTATNLANTVAMRLGDVDNDGDLDALVYNRVSGEAMHVFLNDGSANFTAGSSFPISSYDAHTSLADIDGDGDLDLASGDYGMLPQAHLYLNNGSGTFTAGQVVPISGSPRQIAFGDVDADGDLDMIISANQTISLSLNAGNGTFTAGPITPISSRCVALADVNGDSALDLLTVSLNGNNHEVFNTRLNTLITSSKSSARAAFQVWPNPVGAGAALHITLPTAAPVATYSLQTLLGHTIRQQQFSGRNTTVSPEGLASGVYVLKVQVPGQPLAAQRIVVN